MATDNNDRTNQDRYRQGRSLFKIFLDGLAIKLECVFDKAWGGGGGRGKSKHQSGRPILNTITVQGARDELAMDAGLRGEVVSLLCEHPVTLQTD